MWQTIAEGSVLKSVRGISYVEEKILIWIAGKRPEDKSSQRRESDMLRPANEDFKRPAFL